MKLHEIPLRFHEIPQDYSDDFRKLIRMASVDTQKVMKFLKKIYVQNRESHETGWLLDAQKVMKFLEKIYVINRESREIP